jgi:hypothetical protein
MRPALFCVVFTVSLAMTAAADTVAPARALTVVLDFRDPHSGPAVLAMEHEIEHILSGTGVTLDWRIRGESPPETSGTLVVVRFKGRCMLEPVGYLYDERGPLAYTYSTDGQMQPFSEVACDRVVTSVRLGMFGGDYAHADQLFGRALGRVVAHELVHILSGEASHANAGVERRALSPDNLLAPELRLEPADVERVRASLKSAR